MKHLHLKDLTLPFCILLYSVIMLTVGYNEYFQIYKRFPYSELNTGKDPLYFYRHDRYRKPYRYPFRYSSSYPLPHKRPLL